jgi:hypothetical protein
MLMAHFCLCSLILGLHSVLFFSWSLPFGMEQEQGYQIAASIRCLRLFSCLP